MVLVRSERSVSSGVRRIDLVAGEAAEDEVERIGAQAEQARADLERRLKDEHRRVEKLEEELRNAQLKGGSVEARERSARIPLTTASVEAESMDDLRAFADRLWEKQGSIGVVAVTSAESYVVKGTASDLNVAMIKEAFGPGGGPPHLIQGKLARNADEAFDALEKALQ